MRSFGGNGVLSLTLRGASRFRGLSTCVIWRTAAHITPARPLELQGSQVNMIVAAVVVLSLCAVRPRGFVIREDLGATCFDITALIDCGSKPIRRWVTTMSLQTNSCSKGRGQPYKDPFAFAVKGTSKAYRAVLPVFIAPGILGGCASHGAPSFVLFGAFFPAWMLCALIGIFGAIAARGIFVAVGLNSVLPFQLFVCSSVGLAVAALAWLIWFG